jgi:hypothetical protein
MNSRAPFALAFVLGLAAPLLAWRTVSAQLIANPHGDLHTDCGTCHTPEKWAPVVSTPSFKHEATGFLLREAHARVACRSCHQSLVFSKIGTACADCHRDAHQGQLGFRCEDCHDSQSWTNQRQMRERHNRTRLPLLGVHANLDCDSCHRGPQAGRYMLTPTNCGSCHVQTYLSAKNPDHAASRFSRRCEDCHTLFGWRPATGIDHETTRFPLRGAHQSTSCAACHPGGRFAGTPTDCYSCHQARYNATTNPNHVAGNFAKTCQDCHSFAAWRPAANIDHNKTRFPLTGAHQGTDCARCHVGGRFTGTPTDCLSCHRTNYDSTTNPNHRASGFPTDCQNCHSTSAWRPAANIDHNKTRFPLTGAHQGTNCVRCHVGGRFTGTPTDCLSCHRTNYDSTTNPNHRTAGFPTDCRSCHSTSAWRPAASIDHSKTRFPLTGAHQSTTCTRCHVNGRFAGTPTDCVSCHRAKYDAATPSHSGFPTTCQSCHSTSAWRPSSFDHNATRFPLTGAHRSTDCGRCHTNGRYAGTPRDCVSCHQSNYDRTTNPNHRGSGFPTSCQDCHSTSTWAGATFNHDGRYFPIYSGAHRSVWGTNCGTCHGNPGNYKAFECVNCHQHAKSETDKDHSKVSGYSYTSAACYRCHPQGKH